MEEGLEVFGGDFGFSGGEVVEFAFFHPEFEEVDLGEDVVEGIGDEEEGLVVVDFEVLVDDPFELEGVSLNIGGFDAVFEFAEA